MNTGGASAPCFRKVSMFTTEDLQKARALANIIKKGSYTVTGEVLGHVNDSFVWFESLYARMAKNVQEEQARKKMLESEYTNLEDTNVGQDSV